MEEAEFAAGVDGAGEERRRRWIAMDGEGGKAAATAATATVATATVATAMAATVAAAKAKRPGGSTLSSSCFVFRLLCGFRFSVYFGERGIRVVTISLGICVQRWPVNASSVKKDEDICPYFYVWMRNSSLVGCS